MRFVRGEGACYGAGSIYFNATTGGRKGLGQVWRLTPSAEGDRLELWAESQRKEDLELPDNIVYAPSGDLIICEDGPGSDRLVGITPGGRLFRPGAGAELRLRGCRRDVRTGWPNPLLQHPGRRADDCSDRAVPGRPRGSDRPSHEHCRPGTWNQPCPRTISLPRWSEDMVDWRRRRCTVWGCRWDSRLQPEDESVMMGPPSAILWYKYWDCLAL